MNSHHNPLVSIIVPFLNQERFIGEAIESVLAQNYENWELILVDDGSTDNSAKIVREFALSHPEKIYLISHPKNLGASAARYTGIQITKGEFITFLDSDDVFFPDTIERELQAFSQNPEAQAVCGTIQCWYSWSDEKNGFEQDFTIDLVLEVNRLYPPKSLLIHNLRTSGRKPGINCIMLQSKFVKDFQLCEESYNRAGEDQVFWAKASLNGKIFVMDACLAKYRQHPSSTCATISTDDYFHASEVFLDWLENYLEEQGIDDIEVWKSLKNFRRKLRFENKFKWIKESYQRLFPLYMRYWLRDRWTNIKNLLRTPHR